jgi:Fuc2NAc and GlcNAc transferase
MNPVDKWLAAAAFMIAVLGTGAMRRYALRKNMLDVPNDRSSHALPTPRGGGVAIVAAFFIAILGVAFVTRPGVAVVSALLAGGGAIAGIGYLDDRRTLSASLRLSVHLAVAILVIAAIGGIPDRSMVHWGVHGAWVGSSIAVLALVCATNVFNFMDGIDGLAAGEAVFVGLAGAGLTWYVSGDSGAAGALLCLAAASFGFLLWNVSPARIFMGDAGSGFLCFTIAVLSLIAIRRDGMPVEVFAILGGLFISDATVTLLRRMLRGDRWLDAHRSHAYQRLARRWNGHLPVTMLAIAINLVWLLPWAVLAARVPDYARWFLAAALLPLILLALALGAGARES